MGHFLAGPLCGRGERIRTSGPCLPKTVLYQAELLPDRRPVDQPPGETEAGLYLARQRGASALLSPAKTGFERGIPPPRHL